MDMLLVSVAASTMVDCIGKVRIIYRACNPSSDGCDLQTAYNSSAPIRPLLRNFLLTESPRYQPFSIHCLHKPPLVLTSITVVLRAEHINAQPSLATLFVKPFAQKRWTLRCVISNLFLAVFAPSLDPDPCRHPRKEALPMLNLRTRIRLKRRRSIRRWKRANTFGKPWHGPGVHNKALRTRLRPPTQPMATLNQKDCEHGTLNRRRTKSTMPLDLYDQEQTRSG